MRLQEPGLVLRFGQAGLQKFCTADDGLQGRFQLVGHVGGEFPAHPLRFRLLRHVKGQQDRTQSVAAGVDAAEVKLVFPAIPLCPQLAVAVFHGAADGGAHVRVPLHRQEIPAQAAVLRAENGPGRRVDAEDGVAAVQQHQPLPHTVGNLVKSSCRRFRSWVCRWISRRWPWMRVSRGDNSS